VKIQRTAWVVALVIAASTVLAPPGPTTAGAAADPPTVSPTPQSMQPLGAPVPVPATVRLITGARTDGPALAVLTGVLRAAGVHTFTQMTAAPKDNPGAKVLDVWVGGPAEGNAGSAAVLKRWNVPGPTGLPPDGYVLAAGRDESRPAVVLAGVDPAGTFYAVQTLRQLLTRRDGTTYVAGLQVRDWPSFSLRGGMESFYGSPWPQPDALHHVDFLAAHKMNAMLYTPSGDSRVAGTLWRSPYPPDELARFAELVAHARSQHVDFIYRVNPESQLDPRAGICHADEDDLRALIGRYEQLWSIGERIFSVGWDDAGGQFLCDADNARFGGDASPLAAAQAYVVNYVYDHFVRTHDGAELKTVPAEYWGNHHSAYRTQFAKLLYQDVSIFWTGPQVVSPTITRSDIDDASAAFGGRKLLIFDNYPVNDYAPNRQHLAPLVGRDPAITETAEGILANEMQQEEASLISLFTIADFAWNAPGYDPRRSWIRSLSEFGGKGSKALWVYAANSVESPLHTGDRSPVQPLIAAFLDAYTSGKPLSQTAGPLSTALNVAHRAPDEIRASVPNARFVEESRPWLDKLAAQAGAALAALDALLAQGRGDRAGVQEARDRMDALVVQARAIPQVIADGVYERLTDFTRTETDRFLSEQSTTVTAAASRQLVAAGAANTLEFTLVGMAPGRLDATVTAAAPAGWQATPTPETISIRSDNRSVRSAIQLRLTPPNAAIGSTFDVGVSVAVAGQGTLTATTTLTVAAKPATEFSRLVLGNHPAGYWRLGDTGAVSGDSSGNGNDGIDVDAVTHGVPGALAGSSDTAVRLVGGYVTVPNSPTVSLTGPFTIAAWIKPTTTNQQQAIIEKYNAPYPNGYVLRIGSDGRLYAYSNDATTSVGVTGATVLTPNMWHFVVASCDGSTLKVFLDGFLDGSTATTVLPGAGQFDLRLGARGDDTAYRLQGDLDEVAVYPSALSEEQVRAQYLAGKVATG
jgi:beta-N-acetylglucosaminidase/Concanavalin A-like lectin/glucanases superfamily/Glycosyl hydrolase family 20, domain 2